MTIYDRESESVWLQVGGRAVKGPLVGTVLKTGPLLDTTWGNWKKLHPDTLIMAPTRRYREYYEPKGTLVPRGFTSFPAPYFRRSMTHSDKRLPPFAMVLAVSLPPTHSDSDANKYIEDGKEGTILYRAYPINTLGKSSCAVNDRLGTEPVGVFFDAATETAVAVSRRLDGKELTFEVRKQADGRPGFYDKETGTRWNIEGKVEKGPLAGKSLLRLDSHMSEWYGWAAYFPQTTIFGRDAMPQPVTSEGHGHQDIARQSRPMGM